MTYILAVDPGAVAGACAILDEMGKVVFVDDLPVAGAGAQRMISGPLFAAIVERFKPSIAIAERVASMPKQGVASSFKFGRGVGIIEGVLGAELVPVSYVSATVWKRHFHLGRDKEQARQKAIATMAAHFARKRDHGRAEAALIGLWQCRANVVAP